MIQFQHMKVPVVTQGVSRKQRSIPTLDPSYAKIDDRSLEDLFVFVRAYAKEIKYKGIDGRDSGNWEAFFEKLPTRDGNCAPHLALLMAFLELFRESQDALNQLTHRHLDHYYKTILGIIKKAPLPDIAHVTIELAREANSFLLPEGTVFAAGKDESGNDRLYGLMSNTQFTKAKVSSVRSLYVDYGTEGDAANPVASARGVHGKEVWNEDLKTQQYHALGGVHLPDTPIGFAVTAPVLFLPEGSRTIKLVVLMRYAGELDLENKVEEIDLLIRDNFLVELSTGQGWIVRRPQHVSLVLENADELKLEMQVSLDKSAPGIIPQDDPALNPLLSPWPLMKVLLDPRASFQYTFLKSCQLVTINIHVHVDGLRNIVIQNNHSVLNLNSPFQPFTHNPGINADFYIGSHEIFRKNITSLNLKMEWYNVPSPDLETYYTGYEDTERSNASFKTAIEILKDKDWYQVTQASLFAYENARFAKRIVITAPEFNLHDTFQGIVDDAGDETDTEFAESGNLEIGEAEALHEFDDFNITTQRGFIRLRLLEPDFGHAVYPNLYASIVAANNLEHVTELKPLPSQPYTPELKSVSLSYSAHKEIDPYNAGKYFFQLHPFGYSQITPDDPWLFPQLTGQGHLLIGLKDVQPLTEISLLIQCLEGTADPESRIPDVAWSYLEMDTWREFPSAAKLYDSTENLNKPGVVTLSIPDHVAAHNTLLPGKVFWIKASAETFASGTCHITDIKAQAASLVCKMGDRPENYQGKPLPAHTITKLVNPKPEIKKVYQSYPSIPGRGMETDNDFYQRIAEQLKHKQRTIAPWDYERMVLEHFPGVYKVKCFRHTHPRLGFSPGDVLLIIIPDIRQYVGIDPLRPAASLQLRESIRQFLAGSSVTGASIEVQNPLFEALELDFMVKFRKGYNNGLYEKQLQEDLRQYLAPWAFDKGREIGFGGMIYKSAILNFIEERPYVDFVTFFKMNQYDQAGNARLNVEEARAITPVSILTSADKHLIKILHGEDVLCADGIGHMIIEESFTTVK